MTYLLILGREPALSWCEFDAVARSAGVQISFQWREGEVVCITSNCEETFFRQHECAGLIKVAKFLCTAEKNNVYKKIAKNIMAHRKGDAKLTIGVSVYGNNPHVAPALARDVKTHLHTQGIGMRFIAGDTPLSSGTLVKNKLLGSGTEYIVAPHGSDWYVGETVTAQNSDAWSARDYGKPARDMRRGMMPPKLARMMVHLGEVPQGAAILDPFCGTGTLVMEALLAGYNVIAGDADPAAVSATQKNAAWLKTRDNIDMNLNVIQADARTISKRLKKRSRVDAIVTEPFLGNEKTLPYAQRMRDAQKLHDLYKECFIDWKKFLPRGARVVIIFPQFMMRENVIEIPIHDELSKFGFDILPPISGALPIDDEYSLHGNLLYMRKGQRVAREILMLSAK